MTVTSIAKDPGALTMTMTAELDAPVERAWQLWADPRQLERWWGPPSCPATVVDHDLTPGGRVTYAMALPDGGSAKGWWNVLRVEPCRVLEFEDGFADDAWAPIPDLPMTSGRVTFVPLEGDRTRMLIETQFASVEDMDRVLSMGAEEGMTAALSQMDSLVLLGRHVAESFVGLAGLLRDAGTDVWDAASMCEGWRVREVVAHVTMAARYGEAEFMQLLAAESFDFTRLSDRLASQDGELPTGTLIANLLDPALHAWTPPGGGLLGALSHVVIHGLDVTAAIGAPPVCPPDALRTVLDDLTAGGAAHAHFGVDVSGVTLRATDIDWTSGTAGRVVEGTAGELVLHLAGRRTH